MIRAMSTLVLSAVLVCSHGALASVLPKTRIMVVNGDQVSEFELVGYKMKFSNPTQRREVELTQQDLKEVNVHLIPLVLAESHDQRLCGRVYLETDTKKGRKTFCLKSTTSIGKTSNELARLLALIVKIR